MAIITGQPSIGFSNGVALPTALPSYAENPQAVIDFLLSKIDSLTTIIEGKADTKRLKTLIQYSDEVIRIQAENIALVGAVTFLDVWRDQTGQVIGGVHPSITRIRGGVVQTGVITSNNWSAEAGTAFDLDNGILIMGGTDFPSLVFEDGNLTISGTLTANSIISSSIEISGLPDGTTLEDLYNMASGVAGITEAQLAAGVGNILAGVGNEFVLNVNPDYAAFRHVNAVPFGSTGPYSGTLRTALAITANGLGAGYNRKSDGVWEYSFAIDGTTGDATFRGILTAGSVIAGSVIVPGGGTMSGLVTDAANAAALSAALDGSGSLILRGAIVPTDSGAIKSGSITWNSSDGSLTGGTGVAITEWGIIGASGGSTTFSINALTGQAVFSGTLLAAGGTFSGNISGASGNFSGTLSGANITGASGNFSGSLSGANISGVSGTFTGNVDVSGTAIFRGASSLTGWGSASVNILPSSNNTIGLIVEKGGGSTASTAVFTNNSGFLNTLMVLNYGGGPAATFSGPISTNDIFLGSFKLSKSRQNGQLVRIYDPSTHALVNTFEYSFE